MFVPEWCSGSTVDFDSISISSILISGAKQNCIGLLDPVGCMGISCLDGDGCAMCHERWKHKKR